MKTTCGIFLYSTQTHKILACHATKARWNLWSIPKGLKEENETSLDAALRELYEETGIDLRQEQGLTAELLPKVTYRKQKKELEAFLFITDRDFSEHKFSCHSLVDFKYPEIDKWKWIGLDETGALHETQQQCIPLIKSLLEKRGLL